MEAMEILITNYYWQILNILLDLLSNKEKNSLKLYEGFEKIFQIQTAKKIVTIDLEINYVKKIL